MKPFLLWKMVLILITMPVTDLNVNRTFVFLFIVFIFTSPSLKKQLNTQGFSISMSFFKISSALKKIFIGHNKNIYDCKSRLNLLNRHSIHKYSCNFKLWCQRFLYYWHVIIPALFCWHVLVSNFLLWWRSIQMLTLNICSYQT